MAQLVSRIPLAQKLLFEPAVAELFQEANPLNRAGTALNEHLIPRIIESKEKQSARNEFVGMGSAAPKAGALTGFPHRVDKRNVATGDLSGIGCEKGGVLPKPLVLENL